MQNLFFLFSLLYITRHPLSGIIPVIRNISHTGWCRSTDADSTQIIRQLKFFYQFRNIFSMACSGIFFKSTMNSSPASRQTTSCSRKWQETMVATSWSTLSPIWWPRLSLIFLKSSKIYKDKDMLLPSFCFPFSSRWSSFSTQLLRLYSPVR